MFRLVFAFTKHFCFDFYHEEIGECNRHFCSHGPSVNLEIVFSVELERIFFECKAEYLFKVVRPGSAIGWEDCCCGICRMLRILL